ncbi:MAG TPA: efflux RND transporter periplasmic adaptor subunit [Candidatus Saccharimonadales bacterium]|nr:efflux RND transporter periplasmic adaptor subunit [Candidatus Saccharimonadales bacterium]
MKWFFITLLVAGLGGGGFYFYKNRPAKGIESESSSRPNSATVEKRDILFAVTAAGEIGPADQVSVRPEINERIAELPVDIGDQVPKDGLLCRLDDKDLQIERNSRLVEIEGARLQVQKTERTLKRLKQLFADKLVSMEVYEDGKTDFDVASNSLERATANLHQIEESLTKTKIRAPFNCTVLTRPVSVGQAVSGSAGFNSGTEIMTIANLNDLIVTAHINQADVVRLTPHQAVDIQVESVPGLKIKGALERIAPQAIIKNGIKGFSARVQVKEVDPRIRPGMTAILNIPVVSAEDVLAVPLAAVFTENNERFVFVKQDEKFEKRNVSVGINDFFFAEVQKGLEPGEVVSLEMPPEFKPEKTTNGPAPRKKFNAASTVAPVAKPIAKPPPAGS